MPVEALRSVQDEFKAILQHVRPKRIAAEMKVGDRGFHFKHFKGYRPDKIGRGRIEKIAKKEIFGGGDGNELFANLIIVHWNEAKRALYREMVAHVQTIDEDVEKVEVIEADKANAMVDDLLERHDRLDIYLCVRLNGVRFTEEFVQARLVRGEGTFVPSEVEAETDADADAGDGDATEPSEASEVPAETATEPADAAPDAPAGRDGEGAEVVSEETPAG